jgi:hypothetical protein
MSREIAPFLAIPLLLAIASCGGSANRQLVSISISPTTGSGAASYTATGTFTASPVTVTPLPVSWFIMGPGIDPPGAAYNLTSGKYAPARCIQVQGIQPATYTVIGLAPASPNAPSTGSMPNQVFDDLVIARTTSAEAGFVAATAQLTCK